MKTVIIGGVAAGLSAASQIKRQERNAQVIVLEKSGDVSYAACGMPYNLFYRDKPVEDLYALTLDEIRGERGIDYRLRHEAVTIDPARQEVAVIVFVDTPTRRAFTGGGTMRVLLLAEKGSGQLLGGQMVGQDVVAKRIDVLATAIYKRMTVFELAELDLSYARPYAPVWDPLLVAANQAVKAV